MSSTLNIFQSFKDWVESLPHEEGFRNDTVVKIVREALGQGFSHEAIEEVLKEYCDSSVMPFSEAIQIIKRHERKHATHPFTANLVKGHKDKDIDWAEVAKDFLKHYFWSDGCCTLALWNENFYRYIEGRYLSVPREELKANIGHYVVNRNQRLRSKKISIVHQEVTAMLYTLVLIPKNVQPPFFDVNLGKGVLCGEMQSKRNWLSLENGLLDLDEYLEGQSRPLMEHTPNYFSFNKLSFIYDSSATCTTWLSFLDQTFSCQKTKDLIQEWFGYHLAPHCRHEKFLVAYGKGRNGKSVILKVLSLMLGESNYRSVGIEAFDPQRTFALASLAEAMANIINDLNEFKKTGEGLLKQFVSGEPITVERKYKDHFTFTPTAKITIATNHHVRWSDKSDGIWKRMILLKFEKQILDESMQDKRLVDSSWWLRSGELSGVLNWALEGLKRLEHRGYFDIPDKVLKDVELCRQNANFAYSFLMENVVEDTEGQYPSHWLFRDYQKYCIDNGSTPLQSTNFAYELQRYFPSVRSSEPMYVEDPRKYGGKIKTRVWKGIKYLEAPLPQNLYTVEHNIDDIPF